MLLRKFRFAPFLFLLAASAFSLPVTLGVSASEGGLAAARTWNLVAAYLGETENLDVRYQLFEDQAALYRNLRDHYVDLALFDPAWYWVKREGLSPLAELASPGGTEPRTVLVVPKNSIIYRPENLLGFTLALTRSGESATGYFIPLAMLASAGVRTERLKRLVFAETSESVLKSVAYGGIDGGAVPRRFLEDRGRAFADFVRIVAESGPLPGPLIASRREDGGGRFRPLVRALLAMKETEQGRAALLAAELDGFRPPALGLYENLAAYLTVYESAYGAPE